MIDWWLKKEYVSNVSNSEFFEKLNHLKKNCLSGQRNPLKSFPCESSSVLKSSLQIKHIFCDIQIGKAIGIFFFQLWHVTKLINIIKNF